jgi:hypothetical protein
MFITIEELNTHLYGEQISAISGVDQTIITAAIDGGVAEAKGYLHAFDTEAIFTATQESRNALLVIFVKDIAVWHYINLANPGVELALKEKRYNSAIAWLKGVQKGEIVPDLPKPTDDSNSVVDNTYLIGSNPKRVQHI